MTWLTECSFSQSGLVYTGLDEIRRAATVIRLVQLRGRWRGRGVMWGWSRWRLRLRTYEGQEGDGNCQLIHSTQLIHTV